MTLNIFEMCTEQSIQIPFISERFRVKLFHVITYNVTSQLGAPICIAAFFVPVCVEIIKQSKLPSVTSKHCRFNARRRRQLFFQFFKTQRLGPDILIYFITYEKYKSVQNIKVQLFTAAGVAATAFATQLFDRSKSFNKFVTLVDHHDHIQCLHCQHMFLLAKTNYVIFL